ncbi:AT-rich interactive domain-containing protein 5-like [Durio zibethinus]|uniref:AT-rich interactive domain-containing protein 5-like n=1 Tax=Durio zibethinus TaxID=66656 RepID=A0A6P5XFG2_DURZI|nr:AT-rich interactive domain-containing protein 5-like [Durio zibethinus]
MEEPDKVTGSVSEAQMDDSKPVMEETENEADGLAPVDTETEAAEVKDQVQVEELTKLEEDAKLQPPRVGGNPYSVEQQAIAGQTHGQEDTSKTLDVVDADGQNEEHFKSEESDDIEFEDVEDKSLGETVTKMKVVEDDDAPIHSRENDIKPQDVDNGVDNGEQLKDLSTEREIKKQLALPELGDKNPNLCFDNSGSDTVEEQAAFTKDVEAFYKEKNLEFKHPKFYKEDLNLLKLWRAVIKLGGYEQVTSCKLWRQVGESFNPPKTCTTVSWTFRIFYEKALLEYEKHKIHGGVLPHSNASFSEPNRVESQAGSNQASGSGRAKRDAAARAMQSWHSRRVLDNGEVCHPVIKDKSSSPALKTDRQLNNFGLLKRKKPSNLEPGVRVTPFKATKPQHSFGRLDTMVIDIGAPADWVKINVHKTIDCYEIYALVPGLLREEVHVQSDPAGRLVISGQPKQLDNPWGVTPFKKVVSLPSRIDSLQTSAVVTLHGQLFVRVPFELPDV